MLPKLLLIEDDVKLTSLLTSYFEQYGFDVVSAGDGSNITHLLTDVQPDLLILDMMLPGLDGLSICRQIRTQYAGKILFLTASDDDMDQVAALEMGADDYVCKPIQPRVLLARIRSLLRRSDSQIISPSPTQVVNSPIKPTAPDYIQQIGHLRLDKRLSSATLADKDIELTNAEFDVLWSLVQHADSPLSREFLVKETRGIEYDGLDRTIDNRIAMLRKKLGDTASNPSKIVTVRGKGYLLISDQWA